MAHDSIKIIAADHSAAVIISDIFQRSVHGIADEYYSMAEKQAWAGTDKNAQWWAQHLNWPEVFLLSQNNQPAAFTDLFIRPQTPPAAHINRFYVLPEYQRNGLGQALYQHLENCARQIHIHSLTIDASLAAKNFFRRQGFHTLRHNQIKREDIILENVSMRKMLKS